MGRGQAVRRGTLDPVFEGSNPSAPTKSTTATIENDGNDRELTNDREKTGNGWEVQDGEGFTART